MNDGRFVGIVLSTALVFFLTFAALHDIAHGNESDYTLEYACIAVSVAAFPWIYRKALRILTHKGKVAWLAGTGMFLLLFDLAALDAKLYPKYANDSVTASAFLAATVPLLGLVGYRLIREARHW